MRRTLRNVVITSFASMLIATFTHAQDPVSAAVGTSVGVAVANATGIIDDVMRDAADQANYVVFNAAVQARMLIESFRVSARDVLEKGFDELDDSQAQLFENIQRSVVSLQLALDQPIEEARQVVEEIDQISTDVLAGSPAILRSAPSVLGPSQRERVAFTFRGLSLDEANPRLTFQDVQASLVDLKRQQATFDIAARIFDAESANSRFVEGTVTLTVRDCALWRFFCEPRDQSYPVGVLVLPRRLATIEVIYDTKSEQRIYADRLFQRDFGISTGDLTRMRCETGTQAPHDPGYFIDVDTLQPQDRVGTCQPFRIFGRTVCPNGTHVIPAIRTKARHRWEIKTRSPAGIAVEVCAQSQMHTLVKKRNGEMFVNLSWKEYKIDDVIMPRQTAPLGPDLLWSDAVEHTLPPDTHSIIVKLLYFDGTSTIFSGSHGDKYVDASWNNATKQLIVRPRVPTSVAGIY